MTKDHAKPAAPAGRKPRQVKPKGTVEAKKPVTEQPAPEPAVVVVDDADMDDGAQHTTVTASTPTKPVETAPTAPDFLSPVSKLELARQIAAKEQAERIALASARRVEEARRKSLKRKDVEASADSPAMPEKVAKTFHSTEEDVEVLESTTVVHSTTTTLTHRRPLKQIEQNAGESATAYALRAAKIRKEERSHTTDDMDNHTNAQPVVKVAPTAYELKVHGAAASNIYTTDSKEGEVEFVNSVVKDSATRGTAKLEEAVPVDATQVDTATSNSRFYVHLAVLLVVVFTVLLSLTELYVSQLPFCSTPATSDMNCRVCPDHGVCVDGVLDSCDSELYVAVDNSCQLSADVKRDSTQMAAAISAHLTQVATAAYCRDSFVHRVMQVDWSLPIQPVDAPAEAIAVDLVALEGQFRAQPLWRVVGPRTYKISFDKAVKKLNLTAPLAVSVAHASPLCQVQTAAIEYFTIWVSAVLVVFGFYTMYSDSKQSEADAALVRRTLHRKKNDSDAMYSRCCRGSSTRCSWSSKMN
ncbi:hypothetical protein, variant [Aphanomyces invadans]|uniref:Man1/Src1 C-terminal domain-containing protein n=1 Tax=Aphanomyces invadans TaxID=157072 RepID=A0A024TXI4_9STRA|nr:hypothetical protein, variant [Aphanomyces invadans]ETV98733.1 hypothetical protein, variant [Aphanomyces invadans]|eukprot:XP_008872930.1 hypothetical protein, variant [Aphanomyces invadans]